MAMDATGTGSTSQGTSGAVAVAGSKTSPARAEASIKLTSGGHALRMRTFCINVDARKDRWARMQEVFRKHELQGVTRIPACTPADPDVQEMLCEYPHKRPGQTACAFSHISTWRHVASLPDDTLALILEDDVRFHKDWRKLLVQSMSELPTEWSVFYLDCAYLGGDGWDFSRRGLQAANMCAYADAYLIKPSACRWLLAARDEEPWWDHETLLSKLQEEGAAYTTMPKLVLQHWDESDIQSGGRVVAMAAFYKKMYFPLFPESLYDD